MGILSTPSEHVKVHAPTNYKWSYNLHKWPYKWITGVITLPIKLGAVVEAVEDLASNLNEVHKVASVCSKGAASEMGRQGGNYRGLLSSLVSRTYTFGSISGRMDMSQKNLFKTTH